MLMIKQAMKLRGKEAEAMDEIMERLNTARMYKDKEQTYFWRMVRQELLNQA